MISSKLPRRWILRLTVSTGSQRLNNGHENSASSRRRARHSRRNGELPQNQPIRQAQCTFPKPPDEKHGNPIAEPRFHEPSGEEERDDDQPYNLVGEGGEGGGEGEGLGDHGDREADERPSADGQRAENEAGDGGDEDGEERPGVGSDYLGFWDGEAEDEAQGGADEKGYRSDAFPLEYEGAAAKSGGGGMGERSRGWEGEVGADIGFWSVVESWAEMWRERCIVEMVGLTH
ncbi:hypothetical protein Salat_2528000 [Sesamum alatum]|uniref:Uncharacterized protein n=1 Tax=Sesamum alatum TaxID=300844 RepID=A0AAE1XS86_9LAMI|nr:hypothetical protein Salat_2528000 [Sesamum alatum]